MKIGVHLLTGYPYFTDSDYRTAIFETAKAAEALGFNSVWVNDKVINSPDNFLRNYGIIEPLITLASLIHLTPNIELGLAVIVLPHRDAFVAAKQAAALDILSEGRFNFGVGIGVQEDEFKLLNADFANRAAVTDETIQVMHTLWREQQASFDGQYYQFQNAILSPKPAFGRPPIWIGGNSPAALRRVARFGDAWLAFALSVEELQAGANRLRQLILERPIPTLALEAGVHVYRKGQEPPKSLPEYHFPATLAGYPDQIIETLKAYQEVGLEHFLCIFYVDKLQDQLEQMRIFAEQVMPHFSDTA